jgi:uncharacterized Fe-S cluster protein YjdI
MNEYKGDKLTIFYERVISMCPSGALTYNVRHHAEGLWGNAQLG